MRTRSKKRAKQEHEYSKKQLLFLENNPTCQVRGCESSATEVHHKKGRIGDLLTDERYFLAVCRPHHLYIENQRKQKNMDTH